MHTFNTRYVHRKNGKREIKYPRKIVKSNWNKHLVQSASLKLNPVPRKRVQEDEAWQPNKHMYLSNPSALRTRGRVASTPSAICVTPCNRQFTRLRGIRSRFFFELIERPKVSPIVGWTWTVKANNRCFHEVSRGKLSKVILFIYSFENIVIFIVYIYISRLIYFHWERGSFRGKRWETFL